MGSISGGLTPAEFSPLLFEAGEKYKIPILNYPPNRTNHRLEYFKKSLCSSAYAAEDKLDLVLNRLRELSPGIHYYICHLGNRSEELVNITSTPTPWAEEYRVSDVEVWRHPDVRQALIDNNITLANMHPLRKVF